MTNSNEAFDLFKMLQISDKETISSSTDVAPKLNNFMDKNYHIDFNDSKTCHDRVLIVEDKKFYVQSGVLSLGSDYFQTLFNSKGFLEADQKEIVLKDVTAASFEYFLRPLYPDYLLVPVADPNSSILVELLSLSFRFMCPAVFHETKKFIKPDLLRGIEFVEFVQLALLHDLDDFKENIVKALKDRTFVAQNKEEIMKAPEIVKNFVLETIIDEKIETNSPKPRKYGHQNASRLVRDTYKDLNMDDW